MLQRNPKLTTSDVRGILKGTAQRDAFTGPDEWNPAYGFGKLDIARVLSAM
jgi:hypothetical protein